MISTYHGRRIRSHSWLALRARRPSWCKLAERAASRLAGRIWSKQVGRSSAGERQRRQRGERRKRRTWMPFSWTGGEVSAWEVKDWMYFESQIAPVLYQKASIKCCNSLRHSTGPPKHINRQFWDTWLAKYFSASTDRPNHNSRMILLVIRAVALRYCCETKRIIKSFELRLDILRYLFLGEKEATREDQQRRNRASSFGLSFEHLNPLLKLDLGLITCLLPCLV